MIRGKKGTIYFMLAVVVLTILALSTAYVLLKNSIQIYDIQGQDYVIGSDALRIQTGAVKADSHLFYLDLAAKFAAHNALSDLAKNGGFITSAPLGFVNGLPLWYYKGETGFPTAVDAELGPFMNLHLDKYLKNYPAMEFKLDNYNMGVEQDEGGFVSVKGNAKEPVEIQVMSSDVPGNAIFGTGPLVNIEVDWSKVPPELQPCLREVAKLEQAALDLNKIGDCKKAPPVNDVCNPTSANTCCSIDDSHCCVGIPGSPCPGGCCGAYVWTVFDVAINKYGLKVDWTADAPSRDGKHRRTYDPFAKNVKTEFLKINMDHWNQRDAYYTVGNFKPDQIMPGDLIYFKFHGYKPEKRMNMNPKGKCPEKKVCIACYDDCWNSFPDEGTEKQRKAQKKKRASCYKKCQNKKLPDKTKMCLGGSSHINIVGLPTAKGDSFHILDISCKNHPNGYCKWGKWHYPKFLEEHEYCKGREDPLIFENPAPPIKAGETWIYTVRNIPECISATKAGLADLEGDRVYNKGVTLA
ncbi:hypothetical protein HN419_02040 [Candidatus Woesearchaeota archaeon]|jgi:hypothetical protein|nr:hypothetical protein [Candidatus Woesearchaeota archaeon]MBT3537222.1 hypothetical protein [Candidatus Woesearchaeota archaeon]MBT4698209.1 hypothetical protein [Candidatus Woesearchaeota archaeon]MBT4717746.1 hypothetical protein [Candidatus Woesearchaeota archaeon]MBT7106468.1 hypothetical protein [Candidatus Woesearchaeota archaeon]